MNNDNLATVLIPRTKVITGGIIPGTSHLVACELTQTYKKDKSVTTVLDFSLVESGKLIHGKIRNERLKTFRRILSEDMDVCFPGIGYMGREGENFVVFNLSATVYLTPDDIEYFRKTLEEFPVKCIYEM